MRFSLPLILASSLVLAGGLSAKDPSQVDASKQNTALAPNAENGDTPMAPSRESNQRPFIRNDQVQDQRFKVPGKIERKESALGEKRAPIDMTEKKEKTIVDRKEYPKPEVKDQKKSEHDQERSRIQPKDDQIKKFDMVTKYQDRMKDAQTAAARRKPEMEKRTTFEKLNRFMFKRNAPGSADGNPVVTVAGNEAPASQDSYQHVKVDWQKFQPPAK